MPYRIQVISPLFLGYFREVMLGIRHHPFVLRNSQLLPRWLEHEIAGDIETLIKRDRVDGIIIAIHGEEMARRFSRLSVPVINISNSPIRCNLPLVSQNDITVGQIAARHLIHCGCRAFAFWGHSGFRYSEQRLEGFRKELTNEGLGTALSISGCNVAEGPLDDHLENLGLQIDRRINPSVKAKKGTNHTASIFKQMKRWLIAQPRPLGVFAVLDLYALLLIAAATEAGLRIPEDIAIMGCGNDDFWCEFESVPLTSIRLPSRKIGYEAASLLERMLQGRERRAPSVQLPIDGIAVRHSTDILYVQDQTVSKAIRFIREHASENIYVADIAKHAGTSLSSLQAKIKATLGRSLIEELNRVRIQKAQNLLAISDMPMSLIAEHCGFSNSQRLSIQFRKSTKLTPTAYRQQFRDKH